MPDPAWLANSSILLNSIEIHAGLLVFNNHLGTNAEESISPKIKT